jgi:CheY-like chemotaxis protein
MPEQPSILAIISDLFFISRVGSTLQALGYRATWLERPDAYADAAAFTASLATDPPVLVILDLNSPTPWADWLAAAKADPATAAIPWLAFGSHMETATLTAAKRAGAERVVARSKFSAELLGLIQSLVAAE